MNNKNTTYQILGDTVNEQVLGKFYSLNTFIRKEKRVNSSNTNAIEIT